MALQMTPRRRRRSPSRAPTDDTNTLIVINDCITISNWDTVERYNLGRTTAVAVPAADTATRLGGETLLARHRMELHQIALLAADTASPLEGHIAVVRRLAGR
jgi:hypothetical protein